MREMSNGQTTSRACELATLLMVIEAHEIDPSERENLISLARHVSESLAVDLLQRDKVEVCHA